MNYSHLSIDIECTDIEPSNNAAILSVGAVAFTRDEIVETASWALDPKWSPGSRSKSTYDWWRRQQFEVWDLSFSGDVLPWDFCREFSSFVGLHGCKYAWGYPVRYDLGHLRALYRAVEAPFPLLYDQELDLSTLRWVLEGRGFQEKIDRVRLSAKKPHDPLDDALVQARLIQLGMQELGIANEQI